MQMPPIPDFNVRVPDITGEQVKQATLADMLNRQKLFPLQMQEAQERTTAASLQNQVARENLANQAAFGKMFLAASGDTNKLTEMISDPKQNFGMTPSGIPQALQTVTAARESILKLQDEEAENLAKKNDVLLPLLKEMKDADAKDRPLIRTKLVSVMKDSGMFGSNELRNASTMHLDDHTVAWNLAAHRSQKQLVAEREAAAKEWKPLNGQLVNTATGAKIGANLNVDQLNQGLMARYQVLHPGEALPEAFTLPKDASPMDFDRIDKLMQQSESAQATKAQRDQTAAIRQQTFELARDKAGDDALVGTDPKTGQPVLVSRAQAQQMGVQNPIKADTDMVNKAYAARSWLHLANAQGDPKGPASDMSIMQLVDKLDSEGKLGPLASRWNDFMAGKWGSGDKDYAALRAKMGLSTTLLMQAHVGSRGGAFMLEHFEDLANAGKWTVPRSSPRWNRKSITFRPKPWTRVARITANLRAGLRLARHTRLWAAMASSTGQMRPGRKTSG